MSGVDAFAGFLAFTVITSVFAVFLKMFLDAR